MRNAGMYRMLRVGFGLILLAASSASPAAAQKANAPSSLLNYNAAKLTPGDGYMVGGEMWSVIKPLNTAEANCVTDALCASNSAGHFLTIGPNGTDWEEPGSVWPGGYDLVQTWRDGKRMVFPAFEADGWPADFLDASTDSDPRFAFAYYSPTVAGAGDPTRNYKRPATFTDETRTHMVYEAGWPTNLGVDFKLRAHQYTMNEANMNDFIVMEITMTNTGEVDANADGTVEVSGHEIDAIAATTWIEPTIAVRITATGGRSNRFGAGRTVAYAGAVDPATSEPYDLFHYFPNVPEGRFANGATPAAGSRFLGVNDGAVREGYTDVFSGHRYMGVKQGSIVDGDIGAITSASPDKLTLFGTHPIGTGAQKGWYSSVQFESALFGFNEPRRAFRSATAAWYTDYGKTSTTAAEISLAPNPAFFSGGSPDDVTTFVVGDPNARPNGDIKYASLDLGGAAGSRGNDSPVWEDALLDTPGNFYSIVGHSKLHTFGQNFTTGNGPYGLAVGESITMVFVEVGGFRFAGIADAARAAEWAWDRGWDVSADLPVPPAPDNRVESTTDGTALLRWTDVSTEATAAGTQVDGYKIYRAARFQRSEWLDNGFRGIDNYHKQNTVGGEIDLDPVNPYFDAESEFTGDIQGTYQPSEWGPYTLLANIPAGDVSQYADASGGYDFAYEDVDAITGFTYWYYVSAYRGGAFAGPAGATNHIESSNFTRNGRNDPAAADGVLGLGSPWGGTWPFALRNAAFPAPGTQELKNIGGAFTLTPPVAPDEDVAEIVTVSPNPYILTGLNDERNVSTSHNIDFLNLPANYTLTLLDVSGQIVYQTVVEGAVDGKFTWNMQSKDGVEVASGLYIYHLEYGDRSTIGHFAILR